MKTMSNGYIMGFLCGYMNNSMNPGVFGYHRGYTAMTKHANEAVKPGEPVKPCKCGKPGCKCEPEGPQKVG